MNHRKMRLWIAAALVAVMPFVAACSNDPSPPASTEITVFAAASLQQTFTELGRQFEAAHPGTTVKFSFGGSSTLVSQLQEGAPADVFASADQANMDKAVADQLIAGQPSDFATNTMAIAVAPGNPAGITSFASLAERGTDVVVCAPEVPCGAATVAIEHNAGVRLSPVSEESSVTDVLGKVTSGQADAGVVYVTDVAAAGAAVDEVQIPKRINVVNTYPIGVLANSASQELAEQFAQYVLSPEGQQVLAGAGFGTP